MNDEPDSEIEDDDGLTPAQREAVRMDFLGGSCRKIGDHLGVSRTTIWKWQQLQAYRDQLQALHSEADKETLAEAVKTRSEAMKIIRVGLSRMGRRLGENGGAGMSNGDLAACTRAALDVYKTTASQTGIAQVAQVDHGGRVEVAQVHVVLAADAEADIFDGSDETPPP